MNNLWTAFIGASTAFNVMIAIRGFFDGHWLLATGWCLAAVWEVLCMVITVGAADEIKALKNANHQKKGVL